MARASVLDLVGPERGLAADHDQGARRLVDGDLARVPIGTRVFIEGPYGVMTGARRTQPKVLLIAGGIGITPLRALLEALPGRPGDMTLLYRVRDPAADRLPRRARGAGSAPRGARVHYVIGRRGSRMRRPARRRRRSSGSSRTCVERDVYLCGPVPMMQPRRSGRCADLGLPDRQIHAERFAY